MTTPNYPQSPGGGEGQWGPPPGPGGQPYGQGGPPPGRAGQPYGQGWPPLGQAGQPHGQQPPNAGRPPGPGIYPAAPGTPGTPAKSSKKKNWISAIVLLVILGGLGIFAYIQGQSSVLSAEEGDCVHVNSSTDFEVVDCSAAQAQYKVVSVVEDVSSSSICDIDSDVDYAIEISGDTEKSLCLQTWLQVGDCVATDGSWAVCASAESAYEVTDVLPGTQDDTGCPDTTVVVRVYSGENNVICLTDSA